MNLLQIQVFVKLQAGAVKTGGGGVKCGHGRNGRATADG